ncbi:MAG TPA: hypothetical protein VGO49_08325 [Bradyrhizobium sp.]|jgi:hypothetical protein|nr:hypothetical protein [Bradyrhizobium sp.]
MNALEIYAITAPAVALVLMGAFGFLLLRRDVASFKLSAALNAAASATPFVGRSTEEPAASQPNVTAASMTVQSEDAIGAPTVNRLAEAMLADDSGMLDVSGSRPGPGSLDSSPTLTKPRRNSLFSSSSRRERERATTGPDTLEAVLASVARARSEEPAAVTVLKSGVVDGMAYSLYSDGSIEAQMPEGMMRFASIDELRSHLDQRP